ncbi:MAG: electron transport complex subunit RsxC, partial [Edwardsiella sp. (in: enterobacteria)]
RLPARPRAKAKQAATSETDAPNTAPPAADKGESPRRQISRATLQAAYAPGSDADTPAASERETPASDRQAAIATAIARVKARQALVNGEAPQPTAPSTPTDAQKAAVAAAIARIKAKQASAAPSEE